MGYTDFHRYARKGNVVEIRKYMKQKNFDLDLHTDDKNTAFALSVHDDNFEAVNILLELGPNVNNADYENDTPLHYAVANGNLEMVAKLIEHGADVRARNAYQITPVWIAAYRNYPLILKLLLYNFADPMVCSSGSFHDHWRDIYEKPVSPLYAAVARNSLECVNVLIQAGYEIHKETWLLEGDYPPEHNINQEVPDSNDSNDGSFQLSGEKFESMMRSIYNEEDYNIMFAKEDSKVTENIALLNELLSRPPTLLSLCRTFIRKRSGQKLLTSVSELGLSKHVEEYLTLAGFKTNLATLRPCKFKFEGTFKRFSNGTQMSLQRVKSSLSDKNN